MPTFHHWRAGKQRNGLTFQTAADARAFDKGIIRAYDELIDGVYSNKLNKKSKGNRQLDAFKRTSFCSLSTHCSCLLEYCKLKSVAKNCC